MGIASGFRRKEPARLFSACAAGLVFVTAVETRRAMQSFLSLIAWESEVWIAEDPGHTIHFNGELIPRSLSGCNPATRGTQGPCSYRFSRTTLLSCGLHRRRCTPRIERLWYDPLILGMVHVTMGVA